MQTEDAYANLVLPRAIRRHRLDQRDAAWATELDLRHLREQGLYDASSPGVWTGPWRAWTRRC
ncbi:hypothetical protein A5N15_05980 [Rothia kristinae]|uniref:Uncharacterized protein n=1 Tax=Rothia kristinae TaxID=37923 RepID=A0A657IUP9_9MICC|nr:hypothetical protein A5N15_05980 [Rothia kristinae]